MRPPQLLRWHLAHIPDLVGGDMFDAVTPTNGGDWGVVVGSWVGSDPSNNGGRC